MKKIIAVTGCPTGIAHTFMAEEALKTAAKKLNVEIKVETNGASGVENAITPEDLKDIYGVIIAADKDVNAERFNGLPVIEVPVKEAIHHPAELINKVVNGQAPRRQGFSAATDPDEKYERESFGRQIYKHLMSGVSNMLPFVVAGGILIAVSFLWGIYSADPNSPQYNVIAATLMKVGQQAFSIMVPVFTAYIAWSISGRPGMVAGFVGGLLANATGAGFLGGIIAGFAAGYFMLLIRHLLDGPAAPVRRAEVDLYYAADRRPGDRRDDGPARPAGGSDQQWHDELAQLFTGSQPDPAGDRGRRNVLLRLRRAGQQSGLCHRYVAAGSR